MKIIYDSRAKRYGSRACQSFAAAFALGEMGLGLVGNLIGIYALFIYTDKQGLPVALSALAAPINVVWDGLDDPLFGCYSRSYFTS